MIENRFEKWRENRKPETTEEYEARQAKKNAKKLERAKIRADVLDMRVKGKSCSVIAAKYGKRREWASNITSAALKEVWFEKGVALRDLELEKLDELHAALWPRAKGGTKKYPEPNEAAFKGVIAIHDRRMALDDRRYDRKQAAAKVRVEMTPEKAIFLRDKMEQAILEYDNAQSGLKAIESSPDGSDERAAEDIVIDVSRPDEA